MVNKRVLNLCLEKDTTRSRGARHGKVKFLRAMEINIVAVQIEGTTSMSKGTIRIELN